MKRILLIIMLGMSQLASAGQLQEIDVANCKDIKMFVGDTLRFVNNFTEGTYSIALASSLFYKQIAPKNFFDFTYTINENNQYLFSNIRVLYSCNGGVKGLFSTGNTAEIEIKPSPIAIYPKHYLLSTQEPFNIGIYIIGKTEGILFDRGLIKLLSIHVDGELFFAGDFATFKNFINQPNPPVRSHVYELDDRCPGENSFDLACNGGKGYFVTNFEIPVGAFDPGTHTIQAQLTLETPEGGEAVYEDKAEYFFQHPQ